MTFPIRSTGLGAASAIVLALAAGRAGGQVTLKQSGSDRVSITVEGQPFSDFYIGKAYPKPFLAPLRTGSGLIVTRRWPTDKTVPGESNDHQHHRGLWIGYGSISGINFWENEFDYKTTNRGTITLEKGPELTAGRTAGSIRTGFAWRNPQGSIMLGEARTTTVTAKGTDRVVDVDSTLTAEQAIHFDDTKEGFFALRVADSMAGKNGGSIEDSNGAQGEKAVWGKRANWVVYSGPVEGHAVQIIMFDHPGNYNHPTRWHVRDYGLFAINPFGLKDFEPASTEAGGKDLNAGEKLRFRYRVIIHEGTSSRNEISAWYSEFSAE